MRVVCYILVIISQLTMFGLCKHVESIFHPSGLFLVTSTTAPDSGSQWIRTSVMTASECRGLVPILVGSVAKSSAEVNNMNGICIHPLGPRLTDSLLWGGRGSIAFSSWNLALTKSCGPFCGRYIGKDCCSWMYQL